MSTPDGVLAENDAELTAGELEWLTEDSAGQAMLERAVDDAFGFDEDE